MMVETVLGGCIVAVGMALTVIVVALASMMVWTVVLLMRGEL